MTTILQEYPSQCLLGNTGFILSLCIAGRGKGPIKKEESAIDLEYVQKLIEENGKLKGEVRL